MKSVFSLILPFSWVFITYVGLQLYQSLNPTSKEITNNIIHDLLKDPLQDVFFEIPVFITSGDKFIFPDLSEATQVQLNHELNKSNLQMNHYGIKLIDNHFVNDSYLYKITNKLYDIRLILGDSESIYCDPFDNFAVLYHTLQSVYSNDLPYFITQLLLNNFFKEEIEIYQSSNIMGVENIEYFLKNINCLNLIVLGESPLDAKISDFKNDYESFLQNTLNLNISVGLELLKSTSNYFDNLFEGKSQLPIEILNDDFFKQSTFPNGYHSVEIIYYKNNFQPNISSGIYFRNSTKTILLFEDITKVPGAQDETFIKFDDLKFPIESTLQNLYSIMSSPRSKKQRLIRKDILIRNSIVKNFFKLASQLGQLKDLESLMKIDLSKKFREILDLRNKATELINKENDLSKLDDYAQSLSLLISLNEDCSFSVKTLNSLL